MGRWLAIDWGEKYIGLAISDPLGKISQGLGVIENKGKKQFLKSIEELLKRYKIEGFVMGFPISLKREETERSRKVQEIGKLLERKFMIPVYYIDERFTTIEAERILIDGNVRRRERKILKNQQSAVIILEKFLESSQSS